MISPLAALAYLGWRGYAGVAAIAGKHSVPAQIDLLPGAPLAEDARFTRTCAEFAALGFSHAGDFEVRTDIGKHSKQRTFIRAFLAPDRSAWGVVYELVNLTVMPQARGGAQKVWAEIVSRKSDDESLTTSSGEPPLSLLDANPRRPVQRFPGAATATLWERHRATAGASLQEVTAEEFPARFTQGWTRGFDFQSQRGLYRRQGERFVATQKLAVRGMLEFHLMLRHRKGPAYALLVCGAVAAAAVAVLAVQPPALAAAVAGVVFALVFRHFELPGALFVVAMAVALGRDDVQALCLFLAALFTVALALQRVRAAKAAERLQA